MDSLYADTTSYRVSKPVPAPLDERSLPSRYILQGVMRLMHVEQQRFFVDTPIISEDELDDACHKVYLATKPFSLSIWITVNVGLYFLIHDLDPTNYQELDLSLSKVDDCLHMLSANLHAITHSLQLCLESSFESARALSLLGMFLLKTGCIETSWRLISSSTRICLDMGMHLAPESDAERSTQFSALVWWLHAMNLALALTLGRPANLRRADIGITYPDLGQSRDGALWRLVMLLPVAILPRMLLIIAVFMIYLLKSLPLLRASRRASSRLLPEASPMLSGLLVRKAWWSASRPSKRRSDKSGKITYCMFIH